MPQLTTVEVDAYAHCQQSPNDTLCKGNAQEPVRAWRDTVEYFYADGGGDPLGNWIERSNSYLRWVDDEQIPCVHCGADRVLSEQVRPKYLDTGATARAMKAQGQTADLLKGLALLQGSAAVNANNNGADDSDVRAELAELKALVAQMTTSHAGAGGAAADADTDTLVPASPVDADAAAPPTRKPATRRSTES